MNIKFLELFPAYSPSLTKLAAIILKEFIV